MRIFAGKNYGTGFITGKFLENIKKPGKKLNFRSVNLSPGRDFWSGKWKKIIFAPIINTITGI
jgi:phosphatidate phosphatase PAH1